MRSGITGERQDIMKEVIHEMFSEEQVQNKIVEIAEKLNKEYAGLYGCIQLWKRYIKLRQS